MRSANSGASQPKSSLGIRWTVIRISQVRMTERSSTRAASIPAAVSPRARADLSRPARGSCDCAPAIARTTSAGCRPPCGR